MVPAALMDALLAQVSAERVAELEREVSDLEQRLAAALDAYEQMTDRYVRQCHRIREVAHEVRGTTDLPSAHELRLSPRRSA